ncbi:MAG: ParA family protein [Deltaproteobacteria bacterium]|nr:MAG: ParA family protein [Deltaproteobacteria bacterium]
MRRLIAFINEKGGSCKTTLASNVGDYLSRVKGQRVLLVDLDPQGQLGKCLGVDVGAVRKTALDMLLDVVVGEETNPALPVVKARHPLLDLIPANKSLALFPQEVAAHRGEEYFYLREALEQAHDYDFILFDAPPSFGTITLNILLAANEILMPVPLTYLALDGAAELTRTVEMVRSRFGHPALRISLVVPTFARRTKLAAEILEKLRQHFPKQISRTVLGYSVLIDQAQSLAKTIFEHAPRSPAARWISAIGEELLERDPAEGHG